MPDKEIEQMDNEQKEIKQKKKNGNSKILAWMLIVMAILTAILGLVMFSQTIGTKLLYMDVLLGRIFRYYWILLLIALSLFVSGICILRKAKKKNTIEETQEQTASEEIIEEPKESETDTNEEEVAQ